MVNLELRRQVINVYKGMKPYNLDSFSLQSQARHLLHATC